MRVLVTGGAGYIGSHTVANLISHGHEVTVLDDLSRGHQGALQHFPSAVLEVGPVADERRVSEILSNRKIDAVIHFAASSLVGESTADPLLYYRNNVAGTQSLLGAMVESGVTSLIFSSSAAVYGEPATVPIDEASPIRPTNPYGETKAAIERMLYWVHQAHGLNSVSLRYFNAAGAHPDWPIGEDHQPETHLIPCVLKAALEGRPVSVFGIDYPTPDGTTVRDYIHVVDLAEAHRLALEWLFMHPGAHAFNLGNGQGFSIREVIQTAQTVVGREIATIESARRRGDPAVLKASVNKARADLGWSPQWSDLTTILQTAWNWHRRHPHGYGDG